LHPQIGLHLGSSTRLHRNGLRLLQQLGAAGPQRWFQKLPSVDPTHLAASGAHLDAVIAARHNVHAIPIVQGIDRLAHLRHAAPQRNAALADVPFADRFVLRPQRPRHRRHQNKQRHRDKQFPLHARPSSPRRSITRIPTIPLALVFRDASPIPKPGN
jgi:hypothetical protein